MRVMFLGTPLNVLELDCACPGTVCPAQPSAIDPVFPAPLRRRRKRQEPPAPPESVLAAYFTLSEQFFNHVLQIASAASCTGNEKWSEARKLAIRRDRFRCGNPGCGSYADLTVHHILPRAFGGTNDLTNLSTLCRSCHQHICQYCSRKPELRLTPGSALFPAITRNAVKRRIFPHQILHIPLTIETGKICPLLPADS
jgi:hypothetical protein